MCGICGVYGGDRTATESDLRRMTDLIAYRGPDRDGFYTKSDVGLAYRRLSIIDLITGDQPIANEDGTVWVVFNGEIYNYVALRRALEGLGHKFRTKSDTEVLVHGYEAWGLDLLQKLNAMFAFALWDEGGQRLLLARDRLGVKPLYYRWESGRLSFASELKCLLIDRPIRLDAEAIVDYLSFQNCYGPKTLVSGVQRLLPGEYLLAQNGKATTAAYWDLSVQPSVHAESEAVRRYLELLEDSVRLQLMSDVPLGAQVSGGMDSSAVVMAARKHLSAFDTFSASFPGSPADETPYARRIVDLIGSRHHEVEVTPASVPRILPKILFHLDEPRAGPGVIPQWTVNELASRHVRVVLTGHGGDELFAGYPSYLAAYMRDRIGSGDMGELRRGLRNLIPRLRSEGAKRLFGLPLYAMASRDLSRYGRIAAFTLPQIRRLLVGRVRKAAGEYDPRSWLDRYLNRCPARDALSRLLYLDVKTYLPSLLENEDRTSMAFSLESRVPMLDHRMAEFAGSLSPNLKVSGLTLKYLPRRALADYLPKEIVEHRKMGFPVPMADWFRNDLASWVDGVLSESEVRDTGLLEPAPVREVVDMHIRGKADLSGKLWALVNLTTWLRPLNKGGRLVSIAPQ